VVIVSPWSRAPLRRAPALRARARHAATRAIATASSTCARSSIQAHERAFQLPDTPCDECALLAGAAHAVAATPPLLHVDHAIADAAPAAVAGALANTPLLLRARTPVRS
jgi:hypothetical protein